LSFYFQPQGSWSALNKEALQLFVPNNEKADVRVYAGVAHAILEFTLGFREQFPMRKKYFYFKDLDPHFALAATALAKAGLQVTALNRADFKPEEFAATLDREFGFIFFPLDNPVTGEIYDFAGLEKVLIEKGFPHLKVTYGQQRPGGIKSNCDRNEAIVYGFTASEAGNATGLALLNLGERMRFGSPVAGALSPVTSENLKLAFSSMRKTAQERSIVEFETKQLGGCKPVFTTNKSRIFDRAVLFFEDMDGHAFIHELANQLDQPLAPAGQEPRFETTSLSRWGAIRTMDWLKSHGYSAELIRGLVTIDSSLLNSGFEGKFIKARENVLKLQNG
jgi:hypothetical protein